MPGAGAFEVACAAHLRGATKRAATGRAKLGVEAFAEALLAVPKILAENSGYDAQDVLIKLQEETEAGGGVAAGVDVTTGEPLDAAAAGVWDNYCVKRQVLLSAPVIASQLLLVDEVMRAGINMRKQG